MTLEKCFNICYYNGYNFAGPSYGDYCYCDNQINLYNGAGYPTTADKCATPCNGNANELCGSYWTNVVFELTSAYSADQAAASVSQAASLRYV